MALTKYRFGDLIELNIIKNTNRIYGEESTIGVNIDKVILPMKGNIEDKNFEKFFLVPPKHFAFNPRGSRKLGLGFNNTHNTYITTFNNNVFRIKESAKNKILDIYLLMYLSRKEWDRRAEYISWGSSTEVFDWNIFCDEEIIVPPIETQQKYVDIYNAMVANQKAYEKGLDDLKLVCDGYIEELRRKMPCEKIGKYIEQSDLRNEYNLPIDNVRGITTAKTFIATKADMDGVELHNYKIVPPDYFAYVPDTSRRGDKVSIALNKSSETYLVSSISLVFKTNTKKLLSEFLMLFLTRNEFDRYARFNSWGSARETFDCIEMCNVAIPIPDIKPQQSIVDIYNQYITRREINEKLKSQIKDICPILIKGSLEEA